MEISVQIFRECCFCHSHPNQEIHLVDVLWPTPMIRPISSLTKLPVCAACLLRECRVNNGFAQVQLRVFGKFAQAWLRLIFFDNRLIPVEEGGYALPRITEDQTPEYGSSLETALLADAYLNTHWPEPGFALDYPSYRILQTPLPRWHSLLVSVELALKSLIQHEQSCSVEGHKLRELYNRVSAGCRERIEEEFTGNKWNSKLAAGGFPRVKVRDVLVPYEARDPEVTWAQQPYELYRYYTQGTTNKHRLKIFKHRGIELHQAVPLPIWLPLVARMIIKTAMGLSSNR